MLTISSVLAICLAVFDWAFLCEHRPSVRDSAVYCSVILFNRLVRSLIVCIVRNLLMIVNSLLFYCAEVYSM